MRNKRKKVELLAFSPKLGQKKGDIPITILVIGILVVCIIAIFSFYFSILKVQKNFDTQIVKEIKLIKEKADFYGNLGFSQQEIGSILNISSDSQGRHIFLERGYISVRYDFPR